MEVTAKLAYLKEQNLVGEIDAALKKLFLESPDDPLAFLGSHFTARSAERAIRQNDVTPPAVTKPENEPLYVRIGGEQVIDGAIDTFCENLISNPTVGKHFVNVDILQLRKMQNAFLSFAFCGPAKYEGKSLRDVHKDLEISGDDFNVVIQLLRKALLTSGVAPEIADEATAVAERMGKDIAFASKPPPSIPSTDVRQSTEQAVNGNTPVTKSTTENLPEKPKTLFESIGGADTLSRAIPLFYNKLTSNDQVKRFFIDIKMSSLQLMQQSFLTFALGGPNNYSGGSMMLTHSKLGIVDSDFDVFLLLLGESLKELGVSDSHVEKVKNIADSVRSDIVGTKQPSETENSSKDQNQKQDEEAINKSNKENSNVTTDKRLSEVDKPTDAPTKRESNSKDDGSIPARSSSIVTNPESLYSRIGGETVVSKAVNLLYKKLIVDDRSSSFFANSEVSFLVQMQKSFLTSAFGGSQPYSGRNIKQAHIGLGIKDKDFNVVLELLSESLLELGVSKELAAEADFEVNSVRDDVVDRPLWKRINMKCVVESLFQKLTTDVHVKQFFEKLNEKHFKQKLEEFFSQISGKFTSSGKLLNDRSMTSVHESLQIQKSHFEAFMLHVEASLQGEGVAPVDRDSFKELLYDYGSEIYVPGGEDCLFFKIGGAKIVAEIVDNLYDDVLADPQLSIFFESETINTTKIRKSQREHLTYLFGGTEEYYGKSLRPVHMNAVKCGLDDSHFDKYILILENAMKKLKLHDHIEEVKEIFEDLREDVLCKPE